ncbi:MAG: RsmD family RNA methyltransferase [Chitinophagales bacterium]
MRIIGGKHKGYRFTPPKKTPARPTTDRAKEALFNILYNTFDFEYTKVLDLFGGTGSLSYEFASRGCKDITLVEIDKGNIRFIHRIVEKLEFPIRIVQLDVFKFMRTNPLQYDLIFAGPPYPLPNLDSIPDKIFEHNVIAPEGWLVLEHNPKHNFDDHPHFLEKRNYGTTIFSIFEAPPLSKEEDKPVE